MPPDPRPAKRIKDPEVLRRFRLEHAGEPCEICEREVGIEPHHRIFRSQGGDDIESNLIWIGRKCHNDIHGGRIDRYLLTSPLQGDIPQE